MQGGTPSPWFHGDRSFPVLSNEALEALADGTEDDAAESHEATHERAQGRTALEGTGVGSAQGDAVDPVEQAMGWWTASDGL